MTELILLKDAIRNNNNVVTVGTFDGVHEGHRALIETVINRAKENNGKSVVITFDPHPREIINPGDAGIKLLTTLSERRDILSQIGIDKMIVIPFDRDFSLLSSEDFIKDIIYKKIGLQEFVIGYDHHFGKDRTGTIDTVKTLGASLGFGVELVTRKEKEDVTVSSTVIREILQKEGDVEKANKLLGRPYLLNGLVIHGEGRGKEIGFRTANIKTEHKNKVVPSHGVYAVNAKVLGKWRKGMMNIGVRPTFNGDNVAIEVHIFDFQEEVYGKNIQVQFIKRLRNEMKFSGISELRTQLEKDKISALEALK